jgi:hypothetical protein
VDLFSASKNNLFRKIIYLFLRNEKPRYRRVLRLSLFVLVQVCAGIMSIQCSCHIYIFFFENQSNGDFLMVCIIPDLDHPIILFCMCFASMKSVKMISVPRGFGTLLEYRSREFHTQASPNPFSFLV